MTQPPAPTPTLLTVSQKVAENVESAKALLVLAQSITTNLLEAEQIGRATLESAALLRPSLLSKQSLEAFAEAEAEIATNLTQLIEELSAHAELVEQVHISMSEAKHGVALLVERQAETLRASTN